jgi:hypothetical protein
MRSPELLCLQTGVNVATEGKQRRTGIRQPGHRLPGMVTLDIQPGNLVADAHQLAQRAGAVFTQQLVQCFTLR